MNIVSNSSLYQYSIYPTELQHKPEEKRTTWLLLIVKKHWKLTQNTAKHTVEWGKPSYFWRLLKEWTVLFSENLLMVLLYNDNLVQVDIRFPDPCPWAVAFIHHFWWYMLLYNIVSTALPRLYNNKVESDERYNFSFELKRREWMKGEL